MLKIANNSKRYQEKDHKTDASKEKMEGGNGCRLEEVNGEKRRTYLIKIFKNMISS